MASLQGHLLIASPRLVDPSFARAVVLVVQHGPDGALGLVVNRPLAVTVRDLTRQVLGEPLDVPGALRHGGPCEGPLVALHTDPAASQIAVGGGVYFTAEREDVERVLRAASNPGSSPRSAYFVGYAGWTTGQLEDELKDGSWLTRPADPTDVFTAGPKLWSKLSFIQSLNLPISPADLPDDPSVN